MKIINKLKKVLKNPFHVIEFSMAHGLLEWLPDYFYIKNKYRIITGKKLCLHSPTTFNEKLQWMKLYDRNPLYTKLVDKYLVREFVERTIGAEYLIPILGIWDKAEKIEFGQLPCQFVLKCTHDSGSVIICHDKRLLDIDKVVYELSSKMKINYYLISREWPYKHVKPQIIAEELLANEDDLKDYKVFNFHGVARYIQVDYNRFKNHKRNIYDRDWNYIDLMLEYPTDSNTIIERPEKLDELLQLSEKLSKGFKFVRTDFYIVQDRIYFGEMTLFHGSGFEKFSPESYNYQFGELLVL